MKLKEGVKYDVVWVDIQADTSGDPNDAHLAVNEFTAWYYGTRTQVVDEKKKRYYIFRLSVFRDTTDCQDGWQAIPVGCLVSAEPVRRDNERIEVSVNPSNASKPVRLGPGTPPRPGPVGGGDGRRAGFPPPIQGGKGQR